MPQKWEILNFDRAKFSIQYYSKVIFWEEILFPLLTLRMYNPELMLPKLTSSSKELSLFEKDRSATFLPNKS